jgi:hypothetical protein
MSTVEANVIPDGMSVPDEAVHQAVEIGPQSRRELTLTITKARCMVIDDQLGPVIPLIPIVPDSLPLLPQYPIMKISLLISTTAIRSAT